jgi:hypothetical protein
VAGAGEQAPAEGQLTVSRRRRECRRRLSGSFQILSRMFSHDRTVSPGTIEKTIGWAAGSVPLRLQQLNLVEERMTSWSFGENAKANFQKSWDAWKAWAKLEGAECPCCKISASTEMIAGYIKTARYLAPSGHLSQPHFLGCSVSVSYG